jgi:hypothetical protein
VRDPLHARVVAVAGDVVLQGGASL